MVIGSVHTAFYYTSPTSSPSKTGFLNTTSRLFRFPSARYIARSVSMKLTKRRSSPYLPVPSSLWTTDSQRPSPNPSASLYATSLGTRSTTSLIPKRLPFRRRGQSAGPELQLRNEENFGADYGYGVEAQTYTQQRELGGNVFISSNDDHCRRPVYTRSISVDTEMIGEVDDRKRDSTGQNRYPPNSLAPDRGWGFGRMRKSRQQDLRIVMPERVHPLGYVESLL